MEIITFNGSKEIFGPEVDLFNLPPTNIAVTTGDYQRLYPTTSYADNNSPITFRIEPSNSFVDLQDSFLHVKARIVKTDGTNILLTDKVAPTNLFLHSLFSSISVKFNGRLVAGPDGLYPYKAWMRNLLKASGGTKESELSKEVFYKDTYPNDFSSNNTGYQKRLALATGSKQFEMIGKISDDIFEQDRYILNTVTVGLELIRGNPNFYLSSETGENSKFRVAIDDISFFVKRHVLNQNLFNTIHQKLTKGKRVKYPVTRTQMYTAHISKGMMDYIDPNFYKGSIPKLMCLGTVASAAFHEKLDLSPFNFESNNLTKLAVTLNGQPILYKTLECNFGNGEYLLAYNTLFGKSVTKTGNGISMSDYLNGNTIYVFDFGTSASDNLQGDREGTLGVELSFSNVLENNQTLVIMTEFQSLIEIDGGGNVDPIL